VVEGWEAERWCVNPPKDLRVDPRWFDGDASPDEHDLAGFVCRWCPVQWRCYAEVSAKVLANIPVEGFYAGRKWSHDRRPSRGPMEMRKCGFKLCHATFTVGVRNRKLFCSSKCGDTVRANRSLMRVEPAQAVEA
jgi:hypothetical protein